MMELTETHFQTNWTSLESHQITAVIRQEKEIFMRLAVTLPKNFQITDTRHI